MAKQSDVHQICQNNAVKCLKRLPVMLANEKRFSANWYQLQFYQIENMYLLVKLKPLNLILDELLPLPSDAPLHFKLSYYIHQAKVKAYFKQPQKAERYSQQATDIFNKINSSFPNPELLLKFANLKLLEYNLTNKKQMPELATEKLKQTKDILKRIELLFTNHFDPVFHRELYANFGHVYMKENNVAKALASYETSLFWTKQQDNTQQTAVAYFNVALAHQAAESFDKAIEQYGFANKLAYKSQDMATFMIGQMRIAQCYFGKQEYQQARELLTVLQKYQQSDVIKNHFQKLDQQLIELDY